MRPFQLVRVSSLKQAQSEASQAPAARPYRAGGIDLLDRLKEGLEQPDRIVDLRGITDGDLGAWDDTGGALKIGALTSLTRLEKGLDGDRARECLREAAAGAATPSLRNMATVGGNLLQRPRCWYFRNSELPCIKKGGDMCLSTSGDNRYNAILGGGPSYIVHPSSLAPSLMVLGAIIETQRANGEARTMPLSGLFVLPSQSLETEHVLEPGEVLLRVTLPKRGQSARSAYSAARERNHHDWPLAEAAVGFDLDGGTMKNVGVVLGHVAPIPWPAKATAKMLEGQKPSADLFAKAARAATEGAAPLSHNKYKIPLVHGLVRDALHRATGISSPD